MDMVRPSMPRFKVMAKTPEVALHFTSSICSGKQALWPSVCALDERTAQKGLASWSIFVGWFCFGRQDLILELRLARVSSSCISILH